MPSVNHSNQRDSWGVTSVTIAATLVVILQSGAGVFGQDNCDCHYPYSQTKAQSRWPWLYSQWHFSNGTPRYQGFGHRDKQDCCPAPSPVAAPYYGVYNTCWRQLTIPQRCPSFPTTIETGVAPISTPTISVDPQPSVQYVSPTARSIAKKSEGSPSAVVTINAQESKETFVPPTLPELR